jgi:hypothetical protein
MLSTPRETRGPFFENYRMALENRKIGCRKCKTVYHRKEFPDSIRWDCRQLPTLPNCMRCGFNDYEYVDCNIALHHIDPYNHPNLTKESIDKELSMMGNTPKAQQEILGVFIAEASSVFREEWMIGCTDSTLYNIRESVKGYYYSMGVDFGKTHDNTVFTLGHIDPKNMRKILDHIRVIPSKGGVEYEVIRRDFLEFVWKFNPYLIVADSTGIGDAVVERMQYDIDELRQHGVKGKYKLNGVDIEWDLPRRPDLACYVYSNKARINKQTGRREHTGFVFDTGTKFELIQYLIEMFAQGMQRIPNRFSSHDVQMLWEELINFGYEYSNSGNIIYGVQTGHDDTVISYALMNWGLRERPQMTFTMPTLGGEDSYVLRDETLSRRDDI